MQPATNTKFRELYAALPHHYAHRFTIALDAALCSGWRRLHESRPRHAFQPPKPKSHQSKNPKIHYSTIPAFQQSSPGFGWHLYYVCRQRRNRPAALVAVYRLDINTLYISNVVPRHLNELTHDQYNSILLDFHHNVLRNLKTNFPLKFILTSDQDPPHLPYPTTSPSPRFSH